MKPTTPKTEPLPSTQFRNAAFGEILQTILLLAVMLGQESAFAQGNSTPLLTTFTNPSPAIVKNLGLAAAALGNDRVLIGANEKAYLFSLDGTLLTTFTSPDPAATYFGSRLGFVGSDRVIIGAFDYGTGVPRPQTGRAFLFTTNGTLITTFINPNPARVCCFGESVAAFGTDRVLIGAHADSNVGAPYFGAAYLFRTNGTLLTTFTNPTPTVSITFGVKVAAIGSDRVLISAEGSNMGAAGAGAAYLYNTNGTLLTTITNPIPMIGDSFGFELAALGSDRVLISSGAAKAYLFNLSGTLLTTFTSPSSAGGDSFGYPVVAVGTTRVLIGAAGDSTEEDFSGRAYLFSTNGMLLNTFTNPTPAVSDIFGLSAAAVGSDQVLIGAYLDDTGAINAGAAYLFDLPYPSLSIARDATTVSLKWVTAEAGLSLQQAGVLGTSSAWSNTSDSVSLNGLTNVVQQTMVTTNRFFRLHRL